MATAENPKVARGRRKTAVTRGIGSLRRSVADEDIAAVKTQLSKLKLTFKDFEDSHDLFHKSLEDETDLSESEHYFFTAENDYIETVTQVKQWLSNVDKSDVNAKLFHFMSLPKISIDTFCGDPLLFNEFITIFDECVHSQPDDDTVKLTRLLQFTADAAKEAIRHCALTGGSRGYNQARKILSSRFGNTYTISHKVIDDLRNGKSISSATDLRRLADELLTASGILKELRMFSEIDNQRCIVDILQRVPSYIRNAWRAKALNERQEHDRYPDFSEFVSFIDRKAAESLDPVYGNDCMKQNKTRNSATACNTSANSSNIGIQRPCVICQANHRLFNCDSFKSMKPQARFDTVKSHKLCFLCLLPGHSSSVCQRTYRCSVPNCGKKHSKFIHVDTRESRSDVTPTGSNDTCPSVPSGSNASANIDNNKSHVHLPIVPVTCNGGSHIFHALLDSGSTNSFVSESLAKSSVFN